MTITTRFSCGDKAWVTGGRCGTVPFQGTIGQVRVEYTDSKGVNGGCVELDAPDIAFDNFKPHKKMEEQYMLEETGIGSGSIYTLGEHIFSTREECQAAIDKSVAGREGV